MKRADLVINNIGQLLTVPFSVDGTTPQQKIGLISHAAIAIHEGKIVWIGEHDKISHHIEAVGEEIDAQKKVVCPCFVDPHTHISGYPYGRADDFEVRTFGEGSYEGIARKGGGIRTTIKCTQQATDEQLLQHSRKILDEFMRHGVGTLEAKSGYGLHKEHEVRQIKIINELNKSHAMSIIPTYLAHVLDSDMDRKEYIDYILHEIIPDIHDQVKAIDVFCDSIAFSIAETQQIIAKGFEKGLFASIHVDQTSPFQATESLAPIKVTSLSHLEHISEAGIEAMRNNDTIAILFPTCSLNLNAQYAPYKKLADAKIRVALSTDWNPGSSPCSNVLLVGYFAAKYLAMPLHEVMRSLTIHPAHALQLGDTIGSLEIGKQADMCIFDLQDWRDLFTQCGNTPSITLFKSGKKVFST